MERNSLASQLVALDAGVLTREESEAAPAMLRDDLWARLLAANQRKDRTWASVATKEQWERFRNARMEAMRRSLGSPPTTAMEVEITQTIAGDGFRVENLVITGQAGLLGFTPLPAHFVVAMLVIVVAYLFSAEMIKRVFYQRWAVS